MIGTLIVPTMTPFRNFALVTALLAMAACDRKPPAPQPAPAETVASVTTAADEGNLSTGPTGVAELDRLDSLRRQMAGIDHQFPHPAVPAAEPPRFRVVKVDANGLIHLEDGRSVTLEGVRCSAAGMSNIKKMIMAPEAGIAFVRPQPAELRGTPANLWEVDEMKIGGRSVYSYGLIAETALTSGWCVSVDEHAPGFNPRYAALEALTKKKTAQP